MCGQGWRADHCQCHLRHRSATRFHRRLPLQAPRTCRHRPCDHPMESSARLWQLASSASGAKGAASGSLKDHAVPKGQLIARHSAGAALPPREPKPVYASCAESLSVGLAPHVTCSACGSSVAVAAPVQDANMKNNQEPDTRHRDPAAGLGLAADQGELFLFK